MPRNAEITRKTGETDITLSLTLDGSGIADIDTGLGFLDHMLGALAKHSGMDIAFRAVGDVEVDDHHTVEDCAIVLGRAVNEALGERKGITRFGSAYAPLDEALVRAVIDLSGRPWPEVWIPFSRPTVGDVATENIVHFWRSFAIEGRMSLHIDMIRGDNDHHKAEAAFKAVAMALHDAVAVIGDRIPSTKGTLG